MIAPSECLNRPPINTYCHYQRSADAAEAVDTITCRYQKKVSCRSRHSPLGQGATDEKSPAEAGLSIGGRNTNDGVGNTNDGVLVFFIIDDSVQWRQRISRRG
jgi:hypothetical protein